MSFKEKRMFFWNEGAEYVGLGRTKFREWADEIGAVRKIGSRVLFDRYTIDTFLDKAAREGVA